MKHLYFHTTEKSLKICNLIRLFSSDLLLWEHRLLPWKSKKEFHRWRNRTGAKIHLPILFPLLLLSSAIFCCASGQEKTLFQKEMFSQSFNHFDNAWNSPKPATYTYPFEKYKGKVYCSKRAVKLGSGDTDGIISVHLLPVENICGILLKARGCRYAHDKESPIEVCIHVGNYKYYDTIHFSTSYKTADGEPFRYCDSMTANGNDFSDTDSSLILFYNNLNSTDSNSYIQTLELKAFANGQCFLDEYSITYFSDRPITDDAIPWPPEEDINPIHDTCRPPVSTAVTDVSHERAVLTWENIADVDEYVVGIYDLYGFSDTLKISTNLLEVKNLHPDNIYCWKVASVCNSDTSQFTDGNTFRTTSPELGNLPGENIPEFHTRIYPNPNRGYFNVVCEEECFMTLISLNGRNIMNISLRKGCNFLEIPHLKGTFLLRLKSDKKTKIYRIQVI